VHIDAHRGGGGEGIRSEKLSKNAIKHEKGEKGNPPRFSDNPKYPPKKNLTKTPRTTPPGFPTMYCASMYFYSLCNISPAGQVGSGEDLDLVVLEHVADLKMKEFNYTQTILKCWLI
jgi:hypothetical protein